MQMQEFMCKYRNTVMENSQGYLSPFTPPPRIFALYQLPVLKLVLGSFFRK